MNSNLRLGRLFGLRIGASWTLALIFALVAWSLAVDLLPVAIPNQPTWAYWVAAIGSTVAFYACLLAHEMSHALVSRSKGVEVEGITLWLFGGVTQLKGEPRTAGAEGLIAVVGPLTSLVLSGLWYGLSLAAGGLGAPALLIGVFEWLALLNVALAVFNLIPAFPLDGGRLLSSVLWWRTGTRERGVHLAVQVGRVLAWAMIALGALSALTGQLFNGLWLAFIGWFLLAAGRSEDLQVSLRASLRSVTVSQVMRPLQPVPDWLTVEQFLAQSWALDPQALYPVSDLSGAITGVVRPGDLRPSPLRLRDASLSLAQVPHVAPEDDLGEVMARVGGALQGGLLVFEGDRLVGTVSATDVARLASSRMGRRTGGPRPSWGGAPN